MKKLFIVLFLVVLVGSVVAQGVIEWTLVSEDAISPHGEPGSWNSTYNEPGAAIFYEGQYHLFVNGYPGFPANNGIGYRVSDDGVTYEWVSPDPILRSEDMPNDPISIAASDVIVLEDGTWVLYYFNFNSSAWPRIRATIGRATADYPTGPWLPDDEPVLTPGESGSWDSDSVAYASILQIDDGFVMYYVGQNSRGIESIGRATSDDGIMWEKDSEPVFVLDSDLGEATNFVVNQVVFDGERWILMYKSSRAAIGVATSDDGFTWTRYADNPIVRSIDVNGLTAIGYMSFLVSDSGEYMLYFEGNIGGRTQVYAARVTIP